MTKTTLGAAAVRLGRSYNQVQRLVMIGEIKGGRNEEGRWFVDAGDLERFAASGQLATVPERRGRPAHPRPTSEPLQGDGEANK